MVRLIVSQGSASCVDIFVPQYVGRGSYSQGVTHSNVIPIIVGTSFDIMEYLIS